jgi:hypothetical protein
MGLLDDAIREHLELKRRRGADPGEIARQEDEAFGPPRRAVAEVDHPALDEPASFAAEDHEPHLHLAEPAYDERPAAYDEPAYDEPHAAYDEPAYDEPVHVQDEPPRPHGDPADELPHPAPSQEPAGAEPAPEPPRPHGDIGDQHPRADDSLSQPTQAFDLEDLRAATDDESQAPPPDEGAEGEDVLEETPEFLQETPEHDRLWFEQRPPRDFDF